MLPALQYERCGAKHFRAHHEGCPEERIRVDLRCVCCRCEEPRSGGGGGVQETNSGGVQETNIESFDEKPQESGYLAMYRMGDQRGIMNRIENYDHLRYDHLRYDTTETACARGNESPWPRSEAKGYHSLVDTPAGDCAYEVVWDRIPN